MGVGRDQCRLAGICLVLLLGAEHTLQTTPASFVPTPNNSEDRSKMLQGRSVCFTLAIAIKHVARLHRENMEVQTHAENFHNMMVALFHRRAQARNGTQTLFAETTSSVLGRPKPATTRIVSFTKPSNTHASPHQAATTAHEKDPANRPGTSEELPVVLDNYEQLAYVRKHVPQGDASSTGKFKLLVMLGLVGLSVIIYILGKVF